MRLSQFIAQNLETILLEWDKFARTEIAPARTMSSLAIRDHAAEILRAIAKDMDSSQTESQRHTKSLGLAADADSATSATVHGELRQLVGYDLGQLGAEFRALRATVLRLWTAQLGDVDATILDEASRFNEGIDQALAESIAGYSDRVANSRDTFLAILGHDLRNPLGALSGCVDILDKIDGHPEVKTKAVRIARRSISSISRMITDLLEYTRTRLGRGIEVIKTEGDFGSLCQEAFDEVRAAHPGAIFEQRSSGELDAAFDFARMRQALVNLLSNAVQHGDRASAIELVVSGPVSGPLTAAVRNQGTPIAPEALQAIFEPLVQIDSSGGEPHERSNTSLGLGLYIAREIVAGHGGTIRVTSSAADGTTFTLSFPRR